jgi:hypothetical protein
MAKVDLYFELKLNSLVRLIDKFELEGHDLTDILSEYRTAPFTYTGTLENFDIQGDLDVFVLIYCFGKTDKITLSFSINDTQFPKKAMTFTFDDKFRGTIKKTLKLP